MLSSDPEENRPASMITVTSNIVVPANNPFNHLTIAQSSNNLQSLDKLKSRIAYTHLQQLNENSEDDNGEKLFKSDDDSLDSNEDDDFDVHDLEPTLMQGIFQNEASASAKRVTSANPDSIKSRDLRNDAFMKRMSIESGPLENEKSKKGTESTLSLAPNPKAVSAKKTISRLQSARPNEMRMNKARKPPMRPKQSAKVTAMGT